MIDIDNKSTDHNAWFDKLAIREVIENWVIWSDAGDWDKFRTVWHEGADMSATWFEASAEDFTRGRREGWDRGVSILHFLGGCSIELVPILKRLF